jgi:hypothetical protein
MSGLKPKAIIFGVAVDILGSLAIAIVAFVATAAAGQSLTEPLNIQDRFGTIGLALMFLAGLAQTGLGGFAAAQMAKVHYVRHGAAVGVVSLIFGLLINFGLGSTPEDALPLWYDVGSYVLVIPVAALGGYLASDQDEQSR